MVRVGWRGRGLFTRHHGVCVCVCVCGVLGLMMVNSWFARVHDVCGVPVVSWCVWRSRGLLACVVCVVRL